jgi:hypothetical protein
MLTDGRTWLWVTAAILAVISLLLGVTMLFAGAANSKATALDRLWFFAGCSAAALAIHAGPIFAPFAVGGRWHGLAFWPSALLAAGVVTLVLIDRSSRMSLLFLNAWKPGMTTLSSGLGVYAVLALYLLPPAILWTHRPR